MCFHWTWPLHDFINFWMMNRLPKIRAHRWKICLKTSQVLAFPANLNLRLVLPQSISLSKFQNNFTAEFWRSSQLRNSASTISLKFLWHTYYIKKEFKKNHVRAAKIIFGFEWYTSCDKVLDHANWFSLNNLYDLKLLLLAHRSFYQTASQLSRKVLKSRTAVIIDEQSLRSRYLFPRQRYFASPAATKH